MPKESIKILAVNPGTKYIGMAYFQDADLRDWGIKVIEGKWSNRKLIRIQEVITNLISCFTPDIIVLKSINPIRRSSNLNTLFAEIRTIAKRKGIVIEEYSIEDLKGFYSPDKRINKRQLAELVAAKYDALHYSLDCGEDHKNTYSSRMFEAVALGALCGYIGVPYKVFSGMEARSSLLF